MTDKKEFELVKYNENDKPCKNNNIKNKILNNDFYQSLKDTMKHQEVKDFFIKYFNDELDTKTSVMYISLYLMIEDKIKKFSNADTVSSDLILEMIHEIITSKNRKTIVDQFQENWSNKNFKKKLENNKNSIQYIEEKMEKNELSES